jgi:hypothetical protein
MATLRLRIRIATLTRPSESAPSFALPRLSEANRDSALSLKVAGERLHNTLPAGQTHSDLVRPLLDAR